MATRAAREEPLVGALPGGLCAATIIAVKEEEG